MKKRFYLPAPLFVVYLICLLCLIIGLVADIGNIPISGPNCGAPLTAFGGTVVLIYTYGGFFDTERHRRRRH